MIDIENEVFDAVYDRVKAVFPKAYVTSEEVPVTETFPCVSVCECRNEQYRRTQDSGSNENHALVKYYVNAYSSKKSGKKSECKKLIGIVDEWFTEKGFTRISCEPVTNFADNSIYRMVAVYTAIVDKSNRIWRGV